MFRTKVYTNKVTGEVFGPAWSWQWKALMQPDEAELKRFRKEYRKTGNVGAINAPVLRQFDPTTRLMTPIGELDQSRVKLFTVFKPGLLGPRIDVVMQPGMKIFMMRRVIGIGYLDFKEIEVFVFGYKQGNQHHFTYILGDGRMFMSNEDNIDIPDLLLYAI